MNKEKWIEEILQTARHIQPAETDPWLATRVEAALQKHKGAMPAGRLPLRWVYLSAAVMIALVVLNILAWNRPLPQKPTGGIQSVMQEYGWGGKSDYSANF